MIFRVISTYLCIYGLIYAGKSTVIINEVRFEVPSGPLNVKETFGDDSVLIHSSGQPVVTNKWGVTLHPLQHGASYYLVRAHLNEVCMYVARQEWTVFTDFMQNI